MLKKIFPAWIFIFLLHSPNFGQISSLTADYRVVASYYKYDSIYVFHQGTLPKYGQLQAALKDKSPATFEWSEFDTIALTYKPPFKTENNVTFSEATNLRQGGYKVHITAAGIDTSFVAWVFLNDFSLKVEKDNNGEVQFYRATCEYTDLKVTAIPRSFNYFNPASKAKYTLINKLIYDCQANSATPSFSILTSSNGVILRVEDPPSQDVEYTCLATDNFKLTRNDKVKYVSIVPKADFSEEHEKKYNEANSAPLLVTYSNKSSENATRFTWIMGDGDTLYVKEPVPHTYYYSSVKYLVKLIAESDRGCVDTASQEIAVDSSEILVPNFFTPDNGDDLNNTFRIYNVSLRHFRITIYSRYGRKIYQYEGDNPDEWVGWDGRIGNAKASEGVYYYVIDAVSWEKRPKIYDAKKYSGFFYLYR